MTTDRVSNVSKRKNLAYSLLMSFFVCKNSMFTYIVAAIKKIPLDENITLLLLQIVLIVIFVLAFHKANIRCIKIRDLLVPAFVAAAIAITIVFYPQNVEYIEFNYSYYVAYCIPAFFVGLCCIDFDENMFKFISIASIIAIITSCLYTYVYLDNRNEVFDELGQSYSVLLCTLLVGSYFAFSKKTTYLVFYILGFVYAVSLGTRGPILCLLVHSVLCFLISGKRGKGVRIVVFILLFVLVMWLVGSRYYRELLLILKNALVNNGYSSRIIDFMLSGEFVSHTSGRTDIYVKLFGLLKERPLIGYGLFGEWPFVGWNAHELYLEVLFEYGYLLGIPLIVWYLFKVISAFLKDDDMASKLFVMAFITFVLVQGVVSYSHLRPELFMLLGCCTRVRRKQSARMQE